MNENDSKILVIIPAYNEQNRIYGVVSSVADSLPYTKILVVDDSSQDNTREEAIKAGAEVITHPINLGYGSSIESGYLYALKNGFDIVIQMDGDGQHVASEIPKILEPVRNNEADLVIGSRYFEKSDKRSYRTSFFRRVGQVFFTIVLRLISGEKFTDPTSGFLCLNKKGLNIFTKSTFPDDFPDADVILIAHYAGMRIKEVPVVMKSRGSGKSIHDGLKPIYYVMKMMLSIFMVVLNNRRWTRG